MSDLLQESHSQTGSPAPAVVDTQTLARLALLSPMAYIQEFLFAEDGPLYSSEFAPSTPPPAPVDFAIFRCELQRLPELADQASHERRSLDEIVLDCWYSLPTEDWLLWRSWGNVVRWAYHNRFLAKNLSQDTRPLPPARKEIEASTNDVVSFPDATDRTNEQTPSNNHGASQGFSSCWPSLDAICPNNLRDGYPCGTMGSADPDAASSASSLWPPSTPELDASSTAVQSDFPDGAMFSPSQNPLDELEPIDASHWYEPFDTFGALGHTLLPSHQLDFYAGFAPFFQPTTDVTMLPQHEPQGGLTDRDRLDADTMHPLMTGTDVAPSIEMQSIVAEVAREAQRRITDGSQQWMQNTPNPVTAVSDLIDDS